MSIFVRRRKFVVNEPDPCYDVVYLGNVVTVLAKGDGCADKALALIWRTYRSGTRQDLSMTLSVTRTGLHGLTKQQGLTEYWAHRITFCSAPTELYPRLFCWIYKHEGKKLKPELRCHAVLCKKPEQARTIASSLLEKISSALQDYKREKIAKQNVRLCGATVGYPAPPHRKILLSVGGQNFRPPLNRTKSAPRLQCIEECGREDDELDEYEDERKTVSAVNGDNGDVVTGTEIDDGSEQYTANDLKKLTLDASERDSFSDESGYQDEKSSLEEEETDCTDHCQVTPL